MHVETETLQYRDVNFELARRLRGRALQAGMCASLFLSLSGAYLHFNQTVYAVLALGFVFVFAVWTYGYAKAAAFELCARQLPPSFALRWCGGTFRILFPTREQYIPPRRGGR
jgi:hypothetical protein